MYDKNQSEHDLAKFISQIKEKTKRLFLVDSTDFHIHLDIHRALLLILNQCYRL